MKMFKGLFSYTEMGKGMVYVAKVAFDLIKVRRQTGNTERVWTWYIAHLECMGLPLTLDGAHSLQYQIVLYA